MAMSKRATNILVRCGTGIIAVALTIFGVSQCSGKKNARAELDAARTEVEKNKARANKAEEALFDTRDSLSYFQYQNEDLKNQIAVIDSTYAKALEDCNKGKAKPKPAKRNTTPARRNTTPASKPATTVVNVATTPAAPAKPANTTPVTTTVTVTTPDETPINATGVTIGDNAHHNIVNINNGTINYVDTTKRYAAAKQTIVVQRRVVCVRQK